MGSDTWPASPSSREPEPAAFDQERSEVQEVGAGLGHAGAGRPADALPLLLVVLLLLLAPVLYDLVRWLRIR